MKEKSDFREYRLGKFAPKIRRGRKSQIRVHLNESKWAKWDLQVDWQRPFAADCRSDEETKKNRLWGPGWSEGSATEVFTERLNTDSAGRAPEGSKGNPGVCPSRYADASY